MLTGSERAMMCNAKHSQLLSAFGGAVDLKLGETHKAFRLLVLPHGKNITKHRSND